MSASGNIVSKPVASIAKSLPEREQEILNELGFGQKSVPDPVPQAVAPGGNGSNGKSPKQKPEAPPSPPAPAPNGKRNLSWSMSQVGVLLKHQLAANPVEAVRMLNESGLPANTPPEQILAHFQK